MTDPLQPAHLIIDGIEGQVARVELPDGSTEDWSLAALPAGVTEGDVIVIHADGGDFDIEVDHQATLQRRHEAQRQLDALNAEGPQGDLTV